MLFCMLHTFAAIRETVISLVLLSFIYIIILFTFIQKLCTLEILENISLFFSSPFSALFLMCHAAILIFFLRFVARLASL